MASEAVPLPQDRRAGDDRRAPPPATTPPRAPVKKDLVSKLNAMSQNRPIVFQTKDAWWKVVRIDNSFYMYPGKVSWENTAKHMFNSPEDVEKWALSSGAVVTSEQAFKESATKIKEAGTAGAGEEIEMYRQQGKPVAASQPASPTPGSPTQHGRGDWSVSGTQNIAKMTPSQTRQMSQTGQKTAPLSSLSQLIPSQQPAQAQSTGQQGVSFSAQDLAKMSYADRQKAVQQMKSSQSGNPLSSLSQLIPKGQPQQKKSPYPRDPNLPPTKILQQSSDWLSKMIDRFKTDKKNTTDTFTAPPKKGSRAFNPELDPKTGARKKLTASKKGSK